MEFHSRYLRLCRGNGLAYTLQMFIFVFFPPSLLYDRYKRRNRLQWLVSLHKCCFCCSIPFVCVATRKVLLLQYYHHSQNGLLLICIPLQHHQHIFQPGKKQTKKTTTSTKNIIFLSVLFDR